MRNASAKLTFNTLTFNVTFINKSHGDIKRRPIWYLKPGPSPKWMSTCVGLVYFQSLVGLWLLLVVLSHELSVNGEKKLLETGILIIKMDIAHFTGKPGNFNSLKNYIMTLLPWNWLKMRVGAKKSATVNNILQMIYIGHVLEAPGLCQQTLLQKLEWKTAQQGFIIIA